MPYWYVDAGALMMLVLLAAIDEGLAGAFIGHPDQKRLFSEIVGLPDEVVPIGLALIGRPAPDPTASAAPPACARAAVRPPTSSTGGAGRRRTGPGPGLTLEPSPAPGPVPDPAARKPA